MSRGDMLPVTYNEGPPVESTRDEAKLRVLKTSPGWYHTGAGTVSDPPPR
jgi:hypothetical protein